MPRFETSPLDAGLFCLRKSAKRWAQAIISARFIRFLLMQSDVNPLTWAHFGSEDAEDPSAAALGADRR
eukprot:s105_g7.t2